MAKSLSTESQFSHPWDRVYRYLWGLTGIVSVRSLGHNEISECVATFICPWGQMIYSGLTLSFVSFLVLQRWPDFYTPSPWPIFIFWVFQGWYSTPSPKTLVSLALVKDHSRELQRQTLLQVGRVLLPSEECWAAPRQKAEHCGRLKAQPFSVPLVIAVWQKPDLPIFPRKLDFRVNSFDF